MKRRLVKAAYSLLGLLLAAAAAAIAWLHTSLPRTEGTVEIVGLRAPIDIVRDAHGVPHIFAQDENDGWFGLGYVHAQDRLWQMELMRRLGAGRLSEVVGPRGLASDRFMRVLGLNRAVEEQWQDFDAATRAAVEAYAGGVNAWMQGRWGALPVEFYAFNHAPEPWQPTDSLLWAKLMGLRLSGNYRTELLRARLLRSLPPDWVAELWPPYPGDAPTTVAADSTGLDLSDLDLDRLALALPPDTTPELSPGGSNAWAVAGARSASGKPLLANDPHLGYSAPVLWYLARIETPSFAVSGATVAGVPFVVLGHNRHLAWGLTTTQSDVQDLFVERRNAEQPDSYDTPDGPLPFVVREERIAIAGQPDEVLKVRTTRHGPVLSDVLGDVPRGRDIALSATFLQPGDLTPQALRKLNLATDWDRAVEAMRDFHAPQQNLMVAVADGTIGFIAPGRVPIRRSGKGWGMSAGWTGAADWTGFIPFEELPRAVNPPTGVLINANNSIMPPGYAHFIGEDWSPPYRAQRIDSVLAAGGLHDAEAAANLQQDSVSPAVSDLLALLADVEPESAAARRALDLLRAWDGDFARHRPEPLIFTAWMRELTRRIFADELGDEFAGFWDFRPLLLKSVLAGRDHWCDDTRTQRTESCAGLAAAALTSVVAEYGDTFKRDLADWRWGNEHQAVFDHPTLGGIPLIGGLFNLLIAADGGDETVNRGGMRFDDKRAPFASVHGAGFRGVYDLADLSAARLIVATGQSGNPLSAHYGDLLEDWRDGRYLHLGRPRAELASEGDTLRLVPAAN